MKECLDTKGIEIYMKKNYKSKRNKNEFTQRVENAWKAYDKGEFKSKSKKKFLDELEKC